MSDAEPRLVDQAGRVLGPKARETRKKLIDATGSLLRRRSLRELRVSDIARKVGTSPATFYQYFKDVDDAVLALAERAQDDLPELVARIRGPWEGDEGLDRARTLVAGFVRYWDRHGVALRLRNLAADQGDRRFRKLRRDAVGQLLAAFAREVEEGQAAGRVDPAMQPLAAAAGLSGVVELLAMFHRELEPVGISREELIETTARVLLATFAPRP